MSKIDLFEMEWENISQKNELEINSLSLFQKIEKELSESLLEEKGEGDSTDGAFTFIENLTNKLQAEFDETIGDDGEKRQLIRSLIRIFVILLNTKVESVDKVK